MVRARQDGVLWALLAALLFGASAPLAKGLLAGVSPQVLAGLLYLGSGVGLSVLWLWQRSAGTAREAGLTRQEVPWVVAAVAIGGILGPVLLLDGLSRTPASAASLLLNLEGVLTALLAWLVFRENVSPRIALGMAAIVGGGTVLAWRGRVDGAGGLAGPALIAGACLCWAIDNNLTQKISGSDPIQIAALKGAIAGSVNLTIGFLLSGSLPQGFRVAGALLLGVFGYGVSLVLFVLALRSLGTARTGAYFSTAPFIGAILSVLIWREPVTATLVAAGSLMGLGVWLHLTERHAHEHVHEPFSHSHRHTHDAHHQHTHSPDDPPGEPHTHSHLHGRQVHSHSHYPDIHHRHGH